MLKFYSRLITYKSKSFNSSFVIKVFVPELMIKCLSDVLNLDYGESETYLISFNSDPEKYLNLKNYFLKFL